MKSVLGAVIAGVYVLLSCSPAAPQTYSGTAIIALMSKSDAVVAADELAIYKETGERAPNLQKIVRHGHVLVTGSNAAVVNGVNFLTMEDFDADFDRARSSEDLYHVIVKWRDRVNDVITDKARRNPAVLGAEPATGRVFDALFFMIASDGTLANPYVRFKLNMLTNEASGEIGRRIDTSTPIAIGRAGILYNELKENKRFRDHKQQKVLRDVDSARTLNSRISSARAFIDLASCWYDDVGPPVDIFHISKQGITTVSYPTRKLQTCPSPQ
jgi:hypothetical protein